MLPNKWKLQIIYSIRFLNFTARLRIWGMLLHYDSRESVITMVMAWKSLNVNLL